MRYPTTEGTLNSRNLQHRHGICPWNNLEGRILTGLSSEDRPSPMFEGGQFSLVTSLSEKTVRALNTGRPNCDQQSAFSPHAKGTLINVGTYLSLLVEDLNRAHCGWVPRTPHNSEESQGELTDMRINPRPVASGCCLSTTRSWRFGWQSLEKLAPSVETVAAVIIMDCRLARIREIRNRQHRDISPAGAFVLNFFISCPPTS